MKFSEIINRVKVCTDGDNASKNELLIYIAEELGEVATCLAVESGLKRRKLSESVESECCDVMLTALAIILRNSEWDVERIKNTMSKKLKKWECSDAAKACC